MRCNEFFSAEWKKNQYIYIFAESGNERGRKKEKEILCKFIRGKNNTILVLFTYSMWYAWIGSDVAQSKVLIMYFICDIIAVDLCTSTMYISYLVRSLAAAAAAAVLILSLFLSHSFTHSAQILCHNITGKPTIEIPLMHEQSTQCKQKPLIRNSKMWPVQTF